MNNAGHTNFDIDAYERAISSRLDADVAMLTGQGHQFQHQFNAMAAAWQPMPPYMFAQYADGLERWIHYLLQAAGPAADWLAGAGRPAVRQRLHAIINDLVLAVPRYRQMAGQPTAHLSGPTQPTAHPSAPAQPTAHPSAFTRAVAQSNREVAALWKATNAERSASHDRMSAARRSVL